MEEVICILHSYVASWESTASPSTFIRDANPPAPLNVVSMPGAIPELSEIGPQLEGEGLHSLREEVRILLERRQSTFPGTNLFLPITNLRRPTRKLIKAASRGPD